MKDNTFQYDNIFDATCDTVHVTLWMIFQFQYSALANVNEESLENPNLFDRKQKFDVEYLDAIIKKHIDSALFVTPPNVVILEPGEAPSKNEYVHLAVDMFLEDFEIRVEAGGSSSVQAPELINMKVEEINPELINMEVENINKEDLQLIPLSEISLFFRSTLQTSRPTKYKSTAVEKQYLK
ncbi:2202_t:CDS:2 [Ambispora gerdemannii]|uniref:2202_t:CDS:1 n=1 Tax=Ambispora gerdemannii TaxID=144530 RepID=A0A9N9BJA9_9GLOM|nr:2202_t:CDS:2 [Ambispora gerdemannii]